MKLHECLVCGERVNEWPGSRCEKCKKVVKVLNEIQWTPSKKAHDAGKESNKWATTDDGVRYRAVWDKPR